MGHNKEQQFNRHLGVYGIVTLDSKILVIKKRLGPYQNRYDLPGGRLEAWENIADALNREFKEETGLAIKSIKPIGVTDLFVKWSSSEYGTETVHHIAILQEVTLSSFSIPVQIQKFDTQDSEGAIWFPIQSINKHNASPLVLEALCWLKTNSITTTCPTYDYR